MGYDMCTRPIDPYSCITLALHVYNTRLKFHSVSTSLWHGDCP